VALFTDVDGTLMDSRSRLAITPETAAALRPDIDLILASSRTLAELAPIQRRLGIVAPLIAENGAKIWLPAQWRGSGFRAARVVAIGHPVARLRPRVKRCAARARVTIVDQNDLLADRGRSIRRTHSVCIRNWRGADSERFLAALAEDGLLASRSGAWITVTLGADKGGALRAILALAARRGAGYSRSVAIGNEANDAPLLAAADRRFAIRNPRQGHAPQLLALPDVHALSASGARAWREALAMVHSTGG
jgi:mannosyl-3-phosphoglycerate phosphatase